jgi:predicted ribosomally synthesized peptide with nif11-like leader
MSREQARACVERMQTDASLRTRVIAAADPESRDESIRAEGFDCSAEEVLALQELADHELKGVVGGVKTITLDVEAIESIEHVE